MDKIGSIVRHTLTSLGGIAVGIGIASPEKANEAAKVLEMLQGNSAEIVGAIAIILGYVASFLKAKRAK